MALYKYFIIIIIIIIITIIIIIGRHQIIDSLGT